VPGRGETIERVRVAPTWWVVVPFPFRTRSPDAYRWFDESGAASGAPPAGVVEAAQRGDVGALGRLLSNDLEPAVAARHPEIAATKERLRAHGALGAVMSGSGPTVVALSRSELHARELAAEFDRAEVAYASGEP
jgi:4-diphosphocytidyl-2-C-methyl-D-erythritol kinase